MSVSQTYIKIREKDPIKAYLAVRGENTYLLESVEGSEKKARYSFVGFNPIAHFLYKDGPNYRSYGSEYKTKPMGDNPLEMMESLVGGSPFAGPSLSRFSGGFVGYMAYDMVRHYTRLNGPRDDLRQPDCEYVLTKNNIIFDHKTGETYLVENHFINGRDVDVEASIRGLEEIGEAITGHAPDESREFKAGESDHNVSKHEFEESVRKAKDYIRDGDAFQIVLSQRLHLECEGDKFHVYRRLLDINPSSYMYYLDFGRRVIVGSSPETMARVEGRTVSTYPIAGTRRRGRDEAEDRAFEAELRSDPKERAEHVMLVDLGRNDVGRVAEYGSVEVTKFMEVERYSHVMHLSSEVTGALKEGLTEFDALASIFPAGTVSGAPKVRAMEIIDELEPTRRGIYAGCVGYFSFNRSMDTAITIRTIVFEGDDAYIQAGAGIVADSDPRLEYKETLNKGRALTAALEDVG